MAGQRNGAPCVFATDLWSCLSLALNTYSNTYVYIYIHVYLWTPKPWKLMVSGPQYLGHIYVYLNIYIYKCSCLVSKFINTSTTVSYGFMAQFSVCPKFECWWSSQGCGIWRFIQRWEVFNLLPLRGDEFNRFSHWAQMFFLLIDQLLVIEIHH